MKKVRSKKTQTSSDVSTTYSASDKANHSNMLTIEELKSFPGCENIDNKEAEEIIQSLYKLSLLTYEVLKNKIPS
jgi:hypothetical protein